MKKILILFLLILSGCQSNKLDELSEVEVVSLAGKSVVLGLESIQLYSNDEGSVYVSVTDFLELNKANIKSYKADFVSGAMVSFREQFIYHEFGNYDQYVTHQLDFDAHSNIIKLSSVKFVKHVDKYSQSRRTELDMISYYETQGNQQIEIDLSYYDMDIHVIDGEYYLPFSVANLLFSGRFIEFVPTVDKLLVFSTYGDFDLFTKELENSIPISQNYNDSINYLRLYFDYFAGVDFKGKESTVNTAKGFDAWLYSFVEDMDDPHTGVLVAPSFSDVTSALGERQQQLNELTSVVCQSNGSDLGNVEAIDDTLFVTLSTFAFTDTSFLDSIIKMIPDYENVVLDLRCNTGGRVWSVEATLDRLISEDVKIYKQNISSERPIVSEYETSGEVESEYELYVLTSPTTYSGGSIFASIIKNNDLGTVLGQDSLGGACSIEYMALSSGHLLKLSSGDCYSDPDNLNIDNGVVVDVWLDDIFGKELYEDVYDYIKGN